LGNWIDFNGIEAAVEASRFHSVRTGIVAAAFVLAVVAWTPQAWEACE
jgi:hypothetical protein